MKRPAYIQIGPSTEGVTIRPRDTLRQFQDMGQRLMTFDYWVWLTTNNFIFRQPVGIDYSFPNYRPNVAGGSSDDGFLEGAIVGAIFF